MIKFEFTLSDADAENLFDCINQSIAKSNMAAMEAIAQKDQALADAYQRDAEYLALLKAKLKNTRIGDDD